MLRIGVDVGGTFTDLVCLDEEAGAVSALKVPSTPGREGEGFLEGIGLIRDGKPIQRIIHGTTVATNTLLERRGARVAMVTTAGFRDLIEIGRGMRYTPYSLFDTKFVKPAPIAERPLRFEVGERIAADGSVVRGLARDDVEAVVAALAPALPDAVAVCFLNAYANDAHERATKAHLAAALPGLAICTSSEVIPEYREFERFSTTLLNAYLMPVMARYLAGLEAALRGSGVPAPVLIMSSGGGTMTPETAARLPVRTILSGPAGGVTASVHLAEALALDDLITYDMGGTSTDVSVIRHRAPLKASETIIAGFPIKVSMVEINTVGAGGGSLARAEPDGTLRVGPESAGALPGPACYGLGGAEPTVTDANLVLGRLNPRRPLGGRIRLDADRARAALDRLVAQAGDLGVVEAAEGIVRIAVAKMVGAIREISVERGLDPRDFGLIAYGGAGPMHAAQIAAELGLRQVIVPRLPGNFSALGLLASDVRWELLETVLVGTGEAGLDRVRAAIGTLEREGVARLAGEGFPAEAIAFEAWADMRFAGQAAEVAVRLPAAIETPEALERLFLARYEERYGHTHAHRAIEVVTVRVVAVGRVDKPPLAAYRSPSRSLEAALSESRQVVFGGASHRCPVYERDRLPEAAAFDGPAIVEEPGATTVVPPGWRVAVDPYGNLRLAAEMRPDGS